MDELAPYKREMAEKALDAKKQFSTPYARSAKDMGVPVRTLSGWIVRLLNIKAQANDKTQETA